MKEKVAKILQAMRDRGGGDSEVGENVEARDWNRLLEHILDYVGHSQGQLRNFGEEDSVAMSMYVFFFKNFENLL